MVKPVYDIYDKLLGTAESGSVSIHVFVSHSYILLFHMVDVGHVNLLLYDTDRSSFVFTASAWEYTVCHRHTCSFKPSNHY